MFAGGYDLGFDPWPCPHGNPMAKGPMISGVQYPAAGVEPTLLIVKGGKHVEDEWLHTLKPIYGGWLKRGQ